MHFAQGYPPAPYPEAGAHPGFGVMPVHQEIVPDSPPPVRRAFNVGEAEAQANPNRGPSGGGGGLGLRTPAQKLQPEMGAMGGPDGARSEALIQVDQILSATSNKYFVCLGRVGFYIVVLVYDILQIGLGWFGLGGCLVRRTKYEWYSNKSFTCVQRMAMLCMSLSPLVWLLVIWSFGFPFFVEEAEESAPADEGGIQDMLAMAENLKQMIPMIQQMAPMLQQMAAAAGAGGGGAGGGGANGSGGGGSPPSRRLQDVTGDDSPFLRPFGAPSDIGLAIIVGVIFLVVMELTSSFFDPLTKLYSTIAGTFCPPKKSAGGVMPQAAMPTAEVMNDINTLVWFGGNIFLLDQKNLAVIVNLEKGAPPYGILLRQAMFMCMAGVAGFTTYLCADQIRLWAGMQNISGSEVMQDLFPAMASGGTSGTGLALTTIVSSLITAYLPFRIILYTILATWEGTAEEQGLKDAPLTKCINSLLLSVASSGHSGGQRSVAPSAAHHERAPMMPKPHHGGVNMVPIQGA